MARSKSPRPRKSTANQPRKGRVVYGSGAMHDVFQAQVHALLEDADITEEERQRILAGMSCPCCGGSGTSLTIKLGSSDDL